jgi:Xaa-Pro aminopeptidase
VAEIEKPLAKLANGRRWRIGYESGGGSEPSSYAAMHLYGGRMADLMDICFLQSVLIPADEILMELRTRKTGIEIERIRTACEIAGAAFIDAARYGAAGNSELRSPISCAMA